MRFLSYSCSDFYVAIRSVQRWLPTSRRKAISNLPPLPYCSHCAIISVRCFCPAISDTLCYRISFLSGSCLRFSMCRMCLSHVLLSSFSVHPGNINLHVHLPIYIPYIIWHQKKLQLPVTHHPRPGIHPNIQRKLYHSNPSPRRQTICYCNPSSRSPMSVYTS